MKEGKRVNRRTVAALLAVACAGAGGLTRAQQSYPNKPVRLVVPFAPGGSTTLIARLLAERLSQSIGQPVVIDNRAGAGGNVGMEYVARAEPDGYTLLHAPIGMAINPHLYQRMSFNPLKDFEFISMFASTPNLLVVHPSVPARNIGELIAYAKANPGKLTYASSGIGTSSHLAAEMLKAVAGIYILHIPYRGGAPAMQDLIGGQVSMLFEQVPAVLPQVRDGRVRALGITSEKRLPIAPEIPAISETLKSFEVTVWNGIVAPKGTPRPIVSLLNAEIVKILRDPTFQAEMARHGTATLPSTPEEYGLRLAKETERWAKIVKSSGAKAD